jgi:hypothetical protein
LRISWSKPPASVEVVVSFPATMNCCMIDMISGSVSGVSPSTRASTRSVSKSSPPLARRSSILAFM